MRRSLIPLSFAYGVFGGIGEKVNARLKLDAKLEEAGIGLDGGGYASLAICYSLLSLVSAPFLLALSVAFGVGWLPILACLAPIVVFAGFMLAPSLKAAARAAAADAEAHFLAAYISVLASAGLTAYRGLEELRATKALPATAEEARRIEAVRRFRLGDPLSAIEHVARRHPGKSFRNLLLGYVDVLRTGGDVVRWLESYAERLTDSVEEAWRRFADTAGLIADALLTALVLGPVGVYVSLAVGAAENPVGLAYMLCYVLLPAAALALAASASAARPRIPEPPSSSYMLLPVSGALALAVAMLGGVHGLAGHRLLALSLTVFALPPAASRWIEASKAAKVEEQLPRLLSEAAEARRIGVPVESVLFKAGGGEAGRALRMLGFAVRRGEKAGRAALRVARSFKSFHARACLWLLGEAISSGGGTPEALDRLARLVGGYVERVKRIRASLRVYTGVGYAAGAILAYVSVILSGVALAPFVGAPAAAGIKPVEAWVAEELTRVMLNGAAINAFLVGLVTGKLTGGSLADGFKHAAVCLAVTLLTFMVLGR